MAQLTHLKMVSFMTTEHSLSEKGLVTEFTFESQITWFGVSFLEVPVDGHRVGPVFSSNFNITCDRVLCKTNQSYK